MVDVDVARKRFKEYSLGLAFGHLVDKAGLIVGVKFHNAKFDGKGGRRRCVAKLVLAAASLEPGQELAELVQAAQVVYR